ncbi:MAG: phage shock protein operon transcriptional activator [Oceanospirillaceae bacterium]|nr:phage shock protein operon transcriptional activator [Oceanospirillaceae bacterium]
MEKQIILGESYLLTQALEQLSLIAPLNKPVLIVGERGTGKELIAERLHFLSSRWQKPFLKINCAALNENLLESTLFGHEAGAFTGAIKNSRGLFERAHEGTLFLDELGTVSSQVQEKLLRVIEYGEFERLGGQQSISTDVRIVAATNADLIEMAKSGKFRADLLDRLAFDVINLPPLRYRPEDILILAEHFAISMSRELSREIFMGFSANAERTLLEHPWPGNIRELKNVVQRSVYRQQDASAPVANIILNPFATTWPTDIESAATNPAASDKAVNSDPIVESQETSRNLKQQIIEFECRQLTLSLRENHYHQRNTASALGLTYHQLRAYLKKYPQLLARD